MSGKIENVKKWIEKGDHDLGTAQIIFLHLPDYKDTIAFHCQQAAEKYLKGYLIFLDISFQKKHSLNYLLGLISTKIEIEAEIYDDASILEDFAIEIRYPDTSIDLSDEDIQQALQISKLIRIFVLDLMKLSVEYDDLNRKQ